jgi:nucleotide-binding universal stress UspA family protein
MFEQVLFPTDGSEGASVVETAAEDAGDHDVDLIVVGTRGLSGLAGICSGA